MAVVLASRAGAGVPVVIQARQVRTRSISDNVFHQCLLRVTIAMILNRQSVLHCLPVFFVSKESSRFPAVSFV